ncbi:magnesium transporter [Fontimonas thermophila]|uniref:Magnesium transporter MgtE n=1 Tax=Fontimonas thermophila TaxID=1076937 RepID=A0A1I2J7P4_9GAMM|nr:magnesium transporter [Fontimonas thermophila]SFF48721.1 magnesium transporter [Fontimonas thermophila]
MSERDSYEAALRRLRERLAGGKMLQIKRALHALNPAEIANLLVSLPPRERMLVWEMVSPEDDGEVLLHVPESVRTGLIRQMDTAELVKAAEELEIDDLADFLEHLPETVTQQVLKALDADDRARLERVLAYEPDTAGGLMNTDTVTVRPDVSLDVVQRYLRLRGELPPHTDALFVVDRYGAYLGALPLDKILTRAPEELVANVMERETPAIPAGESAHDVARRFESADLISAPVVDAKGVLIGRITIDDVVDVIRSEAEHNMMSMAGLTEDEDLFAPVRSAMSRRAIWLGINLLTAFAAASVVGRFESTIAQVTALAVFMPIIASMGGIGGSQTLTLMIRGLALGQVGRGNFRFLIGKEIALAAFNGLLWGLVVGGVALYFFDNGLLALVACLAMLVNQLMGACSGVLVPLLLKRIGVDPALAGSVVLTTVTDVVGFFALLGLGTLILL